jgi:hypothetical protein
VENRNNGWPGSAHLEHVRSNVAVERNIFRLANTNDNPLEFLGTSPPIRFVGNVIEDNISEMVTGTLLTGDANHGDIAYNLFRNNRNSHGGAVFANQNSRVRIHHNVLLNNVANSGIGSVLYTNTNARPSLDSNLIAGNPGETIRYAYYLSPLDARNNWWGDSSGPYHPTLNPEGRGDTLLSDRVLFIPWLTSPPDTTMPNRIGEQRPEITSTWRIAALYPNPFNSEIRLDIAGFTRSDFRLSLYNLLGQEVDLIHSGELTGRAVHYSAPPNLASGVYFVRAADRVTAQTLKVIFLK